MESRDPRQRAPMQDDSQNSGNLSILFEVLSNLEKSLEEMIYEPEETQNLMFMKKIDLVKALDAIVYRVKITNQLCDVKEIIGNLKDGFSQLTCTQHGCSDKAIVALKIDEDSPAELYCKTHSSSVDQQSEGYHDLKKRF